MMLREASSARTLMADDPIVRVFARANRTLTDRVRELEQESERLAQVAAAMCVAFGLMVVLAVVLAIMLWRVA